jgi:hypothetical protein
MDSNPNEMAYSKNVLEVITICNEFCMFLEEIGKYEKQYIYSYLQKILPLLYLKGALIPYVEVSSGEITERFVTQEEWQDIYNSLKNKFGNDNSFKFIDYKAKFDDGFEDGSISEMLADIYQELKDFLILYQKNTTTARENSVHTLREMFEVYWGVRVINVHKAIHMLLYGKGKKNSPLFSGFSSN